MNKKIKNIRVKVFAKAKKEKFVPPSGEANEMFEIFVREPAQKNLANFRVRELVAEYFGTTLSDVRILTGHHSPKKKLEVTM